MSRLSSNSKLNCAVQLPQYHREDHGIGILHLGVGAFHKAHQAVYTDSAIADQGGDWSILGVSLRSSDIAQQLNPQQGLYSVIEKGPEQTSARVIGCIKQVIASVDDYQAMLDALINPNIRILTLTVTEKGYGINHHDMKADMHNLTVSEDIKNPTLPKGVLGLISYALAHRMRHQLEPISIISCDNMPSNGRRLKSGVIDFAQKIDSHLASWIDKNITFPSTMVDRITPAQTIESTDQAAKLLGVDDHASVETESFSQWIISDEFATSRPYWEAGGAIFVSDCEPYEKMKLRMLNGAHSLIAYVSVAIDCLFVKDAMNYPIIKQLIEQYLKAASQTLDPLDKINFDDYADELIHRFSNPHILHKTHQIAMDGSQKMPVRIFDTAVDAYLREQDLRLFALVTAAWMRYCLGRSESGYRYNLNDPLAAQITATIQSDDSPNAKNITYALFEFEHLFPQVLVSHEPFKHQVVEILTSLLENGMIATLECELNVLS